MLRRAHQIDATLSEEGRHSRVENEVKRKTLDEEAGQKSADDEEVRGKSEEEEEKLNSLPGEGVAEEQCSITKVKLRQVRFSI